MSRASASHESRAPLIVLVDRVNRAMQRHMVDFARRHGYPDAKPAHNAIFGRLPEEGARSVDLAARAGVTRQAMGESIRELVDLGLLEMRPDPADRRAKLVTYTEQGLAQARMGSRHIQQMEQRFAEEFGDELYASTRDVLSRIVGLLDDMATD